MKYHIILETNGTVKQQLSQRKQFTQRKQLSQRAHTLDKAIKRARKLAAEMYPGKYLTNTSTGCIIEEYTEVYVIEQGLVNV